MKTQEEVKSLMEATKIVTKELVSATFNSDDRVLMAMLLMPLLPALDDFMDALKAETQKMQTSIEEKPVEDPLDKILRQIKLDGTLS